jgi:hypothetical protein
MGIPDFADDQKSMVIWRSSVPNEVADRIFLAEEPLREGSIENSYGLRMLLIGVAERPSSQERNAHGVEVIRTDVVFFSMHLRF